MSLKDLIKVADYYNVKYSFGQAVKIDAGYQRLINRILEAYKLGEGIAEDGWWGGETTRALNVIQEHFNLNPFNQSKESLDQLNEVFRTSRFNPKSGYPQMTIELLNMISDFRKFLILKHENQSNWNAPDLIIDFFEGVKSYLDNIISLSEKLKKIPDESINESISNIISVSTESRNRINDRLELAKQLSNAQDNNQNTKPIIEKMINAQKQKKENIIEGLLENASKINQQVSKSYSSSGQYMPKEL